MATPRINSDFVLVSDCDTTTNWADPLSGKVIQETDIKIQGNASIGTECKQVARYELQYDMGAGTDLTGQHIMMWIYFVGPGFCSTKAAAGITVRVQDTGGNIGDYYVGGSDVSWVGKGWKLVVVDVDRDFDENNGTDPTRTTIQYISATAQVTTAVGKGTAFAVDIIRYGSRFEITGGDGDDAVSFQDVIDKDETDDTYFGIVQRDKNGNLELNGKIYLGDPSGTRGFTTVFKDTEEIAIFGDNPVASGYYGIEISQTDPGITSVTLGDAVASGQSTIGSKGVTIISDETEWIHRPTFIVNNASGIGLYSLNTKDLDNVYLGLSGVAIPGPNISVVDSTFNDIGRMTKNIDEDTGSPLLLRNKVSFARDQSASINLIDQEDIDKNKFDIVQSRGFIHSPPGIDEFRNINYNFNQFLKPYINVNLTETWNAVNPIWTIYPSGQEELNFINPTGASVNVKYDINSIIKTPAGVAISGTHIWIGETSPGIELPSGNRQSTVADGAASSRYLQNTYTDLNASGLNTDPKTDTFYKAYFYTKSPFVTSLGTVSAAIDQNVTLVTDANIDETAQDTAIINGSGIVVTRDDLTPFGIIEFTGGNGGTILDGDVIKGGTSNASGVYRETAEGDTTDGKLFLEDVDGTFSSGEDLDIVSGAGTWDNATYVATSQLEFTWGVNANNKTLQVTYDYLSAQIAQDNDNIDDIFVEAIEWGEDENALLIQAIGGDTYKTERTERISEGVYVYSRGAGSISYFTSDDGTTFTPPVTYTFTLTDLKTDSEVRIYEDIAGKPGVELVGTESSSDTFQYTYTYDGSDVDIIVVIFHLSWKEIRLFLTLTNADASQSIQQQTDRIYNNP